jgi:Tfp pilus assembly protein PilF
MKHQPLKLTEHLLQIGKHYLEQGRDQEALLVFSKLVRFGHLPAPLAEVAQFHLAEIHLRRGQPQQARRHLHVALVHHPESARYHHLMAITLDEDDQADPLRSLHHYRRAAELAPEDASYVADYAQCLIDLGDQEEGMRRLEAAMELAPQEVKYVRLLAINLLETAEFERARRVVLQAMFRDPDDPKLRQLWDEIRFQEARHSQQKSRQLARVPAASGLVLLQFVRQQQPAQGQRVRLKDKTVLRIDPPTNPTPHKPRNQKRRQSR